MSTILKQSTQVVVRVGPFVDATNGVTPETGITLGAADQAEALKAAGAATVDISAATWAAITFAGGWYDLTLTTSHTDTVGELVIVVQDESVCLPVFVRFQVVEEAVYDMLYGASALGYVANAPVNVAQLSGDATAADNAEAFFDGTGYAGTNNVIPLVTTTTTATNVTTVNGLAANVITATSIAADAITDAKVASDVTIASVTGAVGSVTGNVGGNVTGSVGSVVGAVGSVTGAVGSVTGNVGGNVTGSVGSLAAQAKADVNAEVLDVLNTDTFAEPAQGAPGASVTLAAKIGFLYKAWRNRTTQTSTTYSLYNDDAATVDHKSTVSDNGTTFDRGEVASGP